MNKRIIGVVLAVFLLISAFAGCGASKSADRGEFGSMTDSAAAVTKAASVQFTEEQKATMAGVADSGNRVTVTANSEEPAAPLESDSIAGGGNVSTEVNNAILNERKMIRSANVTVEVENFDEAYGKLNTFILGIGFIQETNINTEKVYVDNKQKLVKRGSIVIRVDKNKFDKVLNSIKGIGDVYSWNISGQDVTDKFIDTESRIRLLKLEEGRLEEYLKKLTDLDQIFKTQSRLTDITQEIEGLSGNLKKMSDLVELSTITINMNEKAPGQVEQIIPKTYGQRLLANLMDSMKGVLNFCGELVIILVAALPVLILLGLFIIIILFIYKRIPKKKKAGQLQDTPIEKKHDDV